MRIKPSKFVLHFRQHQEYLWEDDASNLVWPRGHVLLNGDPVQRLDLNSRGAYYWRDYQAPAPPQVLNVNDAEWISCVLIVSSDITEPLEARAVHVYDAPLTATASDTTF
jgi:hypothetical protein